LAVEQTMIFERDEKQFYVYNHAKAMCPRFQKDLLEPAVSEEDRELIQKMSGLIVLGVNRPQRIYVFRGAPNTGKRDWADRSQS
jgi:hypothetical protein